MSSLQELLSEVDERDEPVNVDEDGKKEETDGDGSDDDVVDSDAIIFAEDGDTGSTTAARKLRALLSSSSMDHVVREANEGMNSLQMKRNETGHATGEQKFKSFTGRWCAKDDGPASSNSGESTVGVKVIERDTRINVTIAEGNGATYISVKEDYRVLGVYTRYDGKW